MKKLCGVCLSVTVLVSMAPWGLGQGDAAAGQAKAPDAAATTAYIHQAWNELSRSMTDCHSLKDVKVTSEPVLYVPAELAVPKEVQDKVTGCGVRVVKLPKRIEKLGDLMPEELTKLGLPPGLLYLPNKYVVPGGRFNEMYGWDSYFIVLGLVADHRAELAKGMVENFWFEIEHYGAVLNANRTYYLTRSQPPFLTSMMRAVYEDPGAFKSKAEQQAWLEEGYERATKDYSTWTARGASGGDDGAGAVLRLWRGSSAGDGG